MCAELRPHVRPLSGTPAGATVPIARWLFVVPSVDDTEASSPKRGSVGCSWMTMKYPGLLLDPTAAAGVIGNPTKLMSGSILPSKIGKMSAGVLVGVPVNAGVR